MLNDVHVNVSERMRKREKFISVNFYIWIKKKVENWTAKEGKREPSGELNVVAEHALSVIKKCKVFGKFLKIFQEIFSLQILGFTRKTAVAVTLSNSLLKILRLHISPMDQYVQNVQTRATSPVFQE